MKLSSIFAALACVLCVACVVPTPRAVHVVPHVRMEVHADTAFTPRERKAIFTARDRMFEQTSGFLDFTVIFDLDFDSISSLREHSGHNTLVRVDSSAPDLEKSTIGYCMVNFKDLDFNNPTKAALVYDRLPTDDAWVHVAMHEMMHMVRLRHVGVSKSIMYASTPVVGSNIVTCMTERDMVELCAVHGCDLAAMKPCR